MTYRGHIKNGSVILDELVPLPDGAQVQIEVQEPSSQPATLYELFSDLIDPCPDLPPDAARNKRHYLYGHAKE